MDENTKQDNLTLNAHQTEDGRFPADAAAEKGGAEKDGAGRAAAKKKRSRFNTALNVFLLLIIVFLLFLIVFMNVFTLCTVSQQSMLPQINDGQRVLLLKTKNVRRQDIFVFKTDEKDPETGKNINLIKRAIGTGGDRLVFVTFSTDPYSRVYLYRDSGGGFVLLQEDYLNKDEEYHNVPMTYVGMRGFKSCVYFAIGKTPESFDVTDAEGANLLAGFIIEIGEGEIFAMGDNRNESRDSRNESIGLVKKENVVGRYVQKIPEGSFIEKILKILYRDNAAD